MLNKLKTWKDSLIDKVTNVSLKNVKVSKTSFRVSSFILSLVLVCTITVIMFMNKSTSSSAEANPTLLADSNLLYCEDLGDDDYRFYFYDGTNGSVKDNDGNELSDFTLNKYTYGAAGNLYLFENSTSDEDDNILILDGTFALTGKTSEPYDLEIGNTRTNTNKIVASKNGATLTGDASNAFYQFGQLKYFDSTNFNTTGVTSMKSMFAVCSKLVSCDLSHFDTTNVTDMSSMFNIDTALSNLDISSFNTSNVLNMSSMFYGCSKLYKLDVSRFDTSNVSNMSGMFFGCQSLASLDVSNFDTINVNNMSSMFMDCLNLKSLDLSKMSFNTSNVTNMSNMFRGLKNLSVLNLSGLTNIAATNTDMFLESDIYRIILPLNVSNNALLPTYTDFKYIGCDIYGGETTDVIGTTLMKRIDNVNPGTLEAGELYQLIKVPNDYNGELYIDENNFKFYHDKILDGNNSDNDITSYFNVYKVSLINNYVKLNTGLTDPLESDIEDKKLAIVNDKNTIGAYFYVPKDTSDTGIYKNDATLILHGLKYEDKDTTLNIHSKVKVPAEMGTPFLYLNSCDVYKLDGGNYRVINETSDPECYHDVSGVATKNLYSDLIKLIDKAYISLIGYAAPSFSDAFNGASKVTTLDLGSRIDFSMYESYTANRMFQQMSNVTYINMGAFNGNLSQAAYMFYKCTNLETIDNATYMIDSNKAGLKDIKFMFSDCESLKNIDWSHWDVSKINNAEHAFGRMHSIDTFDFLNWDCKLSVVQSMFAAVECANPINFGNMNFDGVNDISSFYQDATLPYYDYTIFKNSTLKNVTFSGYGNKNIIDFEGVDFSNVNYMYGDHDVHFGTMANASEIILPDSQYGREGDLNTYPQYMDLGNQIKKIWQGYSKNSSTGDLEVIDNYYVYDGYVPVAGSDYTGTLYAIKQVAAEEMTVIDGKYYYKNQWVQGTTKHSILTYYDSDGYVRPCVWDISKAEDNSIMCYIYDDGTMLFDGAGPIKGSGDGYATNEFIPWRMTYKDKDGNDFIPIDNVTKIIGSNAGFKPEGSLAYYFSPITIKDTEFKNHIKTVDVTNFDTSKVNCFDFTFSGINNVDGIEFINIDKLNTSMALSMKSMFEGVNNCASLDLHATIDNTDPLNVIKYWDVSKVHDFGNMFYSARIDTVNLDYWNLDSTYTDPNGINFAGLFGFVWAAHIKNLSLNNWNNTGKINPARFLAYVWELNSVDLSSFNFEINQENISFLYHRYSVNEIILPNTLSADKINVLSDWDAQQSYGYYGCNKDGEVVTTMPYKYLIGKVDSNGDGDFLDKTDIYMFKLISDTLYTDSDTSVSYYRGGTSKSSGDDAVTLVKEFDVTNTSGPNNTPAGSVKAYLYSDGLLIFDGTGDIKMSRDYNDTDDITTEELEFLSNDTYRNKVTKVVGSIRGFKPSGYLRYLCYNMDNLVEFDGTNFDLTNVTSLMSMFDNKTSDGASKLETVTFKITNPDTNTNSVTRCNGMFNECSSLTSVDFSGCTFNSLKDTSYMFNNCTNLTSIDLSSLNCELTDVSGMFGGCTGLTTLTLGDDTNGYNISLNTDNISCMFTNTGLSKIDFSKFKESEQAIKRLEGAAGFNPYCTLIDLSSLDLSLATLANTEDNNEKRRLFYCANWDYDYYKDTNKIETIILPSDVPTGTDALYLPHVDGYVWQGYAIDGTTKAGGTFTTLPKAGEVSNLNMIKLVRAALYVDDTVSSNIIEYYSNGTNKADITLDQYDSDNNGTDDTYCVWNLSTDGSVKAYLYTDGTLILDGEGTIDNVTNNGNDNNEICHIIYPWRQYKKLESIKKVVGSINGFTPHGSIESLLDFKIDTTYYTTPTNNNSIEMTHNLNNIDLTNFDTSNVTNMRAAFRGIRTNLTFKGLKSLDVSKVINFSDMFNGIVPNGSSVVYDLDGWILKPSSDIDMSNMFAASKISIFSKIGNWTNTSSIANISGFASAGYVFTLDMSSWDLTNSYLKNSDNYLGFISNTYSINTINLPNSLDSDCILTLPTKNYYSWYGYDSSGVKTGDTFTTIIASEGEGSGNNVTIKQERDVLYEKDGVIYYKDGTNKTGDDAITLDKYDHDDNDATPQISCVWDISASKNKSMYAYLYTDGTMIFDGKGSNEYYINTVDRPWVSIKDRVKRVFASNGGFQPTCINYYFDGFSNLETFDDTRFDLTNVTSLYGLFKGCSKITSIKFTTKPKNLSINYNLFEGCTNLQTLDLSGFNGYKLNSNSHFLFSGCSNLATITGLSDIDFSSVNNAFGMFSNCYKLDSIEINSLTSVTDLRQMFMSNNDLTTLKLNNLNTTNVDSNNYNFMLSNNSKLSSLDLKNANISNMPSTIINNITSLREVILPSDVPALADAIVLPAVTNHVWFGYAIDGTTKVGGMFTTLPKAGEVPDLYMIKLESYTTMFSIDGTNYDANDKVDEWDISKKNNGSIKAYLFKDPTDSDDLTLVFDQTSDKFDDGDNDYNVVKYYDNSSLLLSDHTPWYTYLTDSSNSSKHINRIKFNSDINFEQLRFFFSYMPDLKEIDLSHFVCTKTSTTGSELKELFNSLDVTVKLNYKFKDPSVKRDISYDIFNGTSYSYPNYNFLPEENNITIDLSGLTFDNLYYSSYSYSGLASHFFVNKIIVPEKINGYTKDLALFSISAMPIMYEAYNDNGTKFDESDDKFLGYTIYLTDNNHAFDDFNKSVSYLKSRLDLAPYAILEAYKDEDIEFKTTFADTFKEAIYKSFNYYINILSEIIDYNRTLPSVHNYEFLYDGTGTDPFNTFNGVIDKQLFYVYIYNGNTIEFITDMYEYMKVKQEENSISDTDFDTLKQYMNEYIHDLFNVATNDIGVLNYLDNLKITITNGVTNILDNLFELYEVKDGEAIVKTYETSDTLTLLLNKEWDDLSSDIQTFFGSKDDFDEFIEFWFGDRTFDEIIAFITGDASDSFIETDSYYVFKISDDFSNGANLPFFYYLSNKESSNIKFYTLGDSMIYGSLSAPYGLYTAAKSSAGFNINSITSDSDVENMFASNIVDTSFEDNKGYFIIDLDDSFNNNYLALPKEALACNIVLKNEFNVLLDKIGNLLYEVRPHSISDLGQLIENEIPDNIPDGYAFNYKRLNVTVNALDISSSNTRVYAGDISSKVFDGVNAITCDSEVHLYYKNNEWKDGDDPIELVRDVDYQITGYSDNDKQGTATIHLQGISPNVTGTRDITFNIVNAIKKLDINNLTISDSEKTSAVIDKDGTDEDDNAISFNDANSNTLHPYILDSDGITPIYLSYTKAYVSDSDGYPNYIARAKDTSDPLALSNITFKGLKLVDQSGAYELYEDDTCNKLVSANNGNDTFTLNDSCKLIDLSSPKIDKIIISNNKNTKLKEEDIVNVSITFSEELNLHGLSDDTFANTYKDDIYLTYKIGLNSFSDYKLNLISIESPRALSVTNRKTVMKFSGKLPSDLGELIDVPFTLYELFMGSITDAELSDLSGNGHDISNFSTKINTPELTGYLVNTKVDEPDPIKPEPEKPITTQTITVQVVKNNKYIEGYSDGTFKPNDNITRGEFSKMLAYISNNYSDSNKLDYSRYINSFKDVNASDWYSSYVGFNNKKQVMVGYSDGTFRPNKELTRAEAAKALTNMFSINNNNTNIASTFNNELNGKWYEYSMKKLINAGLLKGYPDGLLRPNDPITRAEMVALINRITNRDINNNAINNNSNLRNIPYDVDSNKWYYKDIISALNDY